MGAKKKKIFFLIIVTLDYLGLEEFGCRRRPKVCVQLYNVCDKTNVGNMQR